MIASGYAASSNALDGFLCFSFGGSVQKSVSRGNAGYGFTVTLADFEFRSVAALGNGLGGLLFDAGTGSVTSSSLIGNGRAGATNCSLDNDSGDEILATGNDWGAATGPRRRERHDHELAVQEH